MQTFFVEITDTFGGSANYSWVARHKIKASTVRGAICKLARNSGLHWRKCYALSGYVRYDNTSGATCAFVEPWDDGRHAEYRVNTDLA